MKLSANTLPAQTRHTPASIWASRVIKTLVIAFMVFDGSIKFTQMAPVVDAFRELGYPMEVAPVIGSAALVCALLYAIPRTAILGAILFTALCGGAIASHLRIASPLFSHTLFGVYVCVFAWGAIWIGDQRLRDLIPFAGRGKIAC